MLTRNCMKIVIVNDYARIQGGAAKIAILSAVAFAQRGYEVEFLAGGGPIGPELAGEPRIKVTCLDEVAHNRDPKKLRGMVRGLYFSKGAKAMRDILGRSDRKDTVVHFHTFRDVLTASVAHMAAKLGFVTVYTAHEYTMGCPYGGFFNFRENRICPLTGLSPQCRKTRCNTSSYVKKLWYVAAQWVYAKWLKVPERWSHVVFISKLNREVLLTYLPKSARYSTVWNALDFPEAKPAKIEDESPFLFVGSLEALKDPVTAAKAAKQLDVPITFVGSGSLKEEIEREYPRAKVTGWVGRDEVEATLQSGRALLFPSIWYEALPCTTLEAAGSGLPIIVSNLSAAVEQVDELGIGEIFEAGNANDLAEKMKPYLDVEHARSQGAATQSGCRNLDLSWDTHIAKLDEIYRSELARQG